MPGHPRARSLAALIGALSACAGPHEPDLRHGSADNADTADTADTGWDGPCPPGMALVGDTLCIDVVEASVTGELGTADQGAAFPDGSTTAVAEPVVGVVPTINLTWYQAWAACDNAGKRLCSAEEWQTACADGTLYPWGDSPTPDEVCAVPAADGSGAWDELQPTASLPGCVGPAGVYDQMGNAWEWADGGREDDGTPIAAKLGGAYYAGGGNALCVAAPNTEHAPDFEGTIAARCCTDAR